MRALRFLEKILVVLTVIGMIMKFTIAGGAGIFIVIPLTLLAILNFPFGYFLNKSKNSSANVSWLSLLAGMAFATALIGILFKLQYWPGSSINLLLGLLLSSFILAICISKEKKLPAGDEKKKYFSSLIQRSSIILLISALLFCIPQSALIRFQYRNDPQLAELLISLQADPFN